MMFSKSLTMYALYTLASVLPVAILAAPGPLHAADAMAEYGSNNNDLNANGAVQAGDVLPTDVVSARSPSEAEVAEANMADYVSDTGIAFNFNVKDEVEFASLVATMNHMVVDQGCSPFNCAWKMIPKSICIGKAIKAGGGWKTMWSGIRSCDINTSDACDCATCIPGLGTVLEAANVC